MRMRKVHGFSGVTAAKPSPWFSEPRGARSDKRALFLSAWAATGTIFSVCCRNIFNEKRLDMKVLLSNENETKGGGMILTPKTSGRNGWQNDGENEIITLPTASRAWSILEKLYNRLLHEADSPIGSAKRGLLVPHTARAAIALESNRGLISFTLCSCAVGREADETLCSFEARLLSFQFEQFLSSQSFRCNSREQNCSYNQQQHCSLEHALRICQCRCLLRHNPGTAQTKFQLPHGPQPGPNNILHLQLIPSVQQWVMLWNLW